MLARGFQMGLARKHPQEASGQQEACDQLSSMVMEMTEATAECKLITGGTAHIQWSQGRCRRVEMGLGVYLCIGETNVPG
jgi:hypothetical protein